MSVLVGHIAPDFNVEACIKGEFKDISLSDYHDKKHVLLVFYPLDFTFVCPTELVALESKLSEFKKRDVEVLACSVDSKFSHKAWLDLPSEKGGINGVSYPILSDIHKIISRDYDVLSEDGVAYRGLFLIDKKGVVRHQVVNDMPIGRSIDEALRVVDAMIHADTHGEVCPANWAKGKDAIKATHESVSGYLSKTQK